MDDKQWWELAACAGWDPEWWADDRSMRPTAVEICLECPVLEACGNDALSNGGWGVVRAGLLLIRHRGRIESVSLVCAHCRLKPVRMTATSQELYCGQRCATQAVVWPADDVSCPAPALGARRRRVRGARPRKQAAVATPPAGS